MTRRMIAALTVTAALVLTAGCSSDTTDSARDTVDEIGDDIGDAVDDAGDEVDETVGQAEARAAAETFRNTLRNDEDGQEQGFRLIEAIERAGDDLPADAEMSGVDDDGDGFDTDGDVQIDVGDESACVHIPEEGDEIDVEGGAC